MQSYFLCSALYGKYVLSFIMFPCPFSDFDTELILLCRNNTAICIGEYLSVPYAWVCAENGKKEKTTFFTDLGMYTNSKCTLECISQKQTSIFTFYMCKVLSCFFHFQENQWSWSILCLHMTFWIRSPSLHILSPLKVRNILWFVNSSAGN